MLYQKRAPTGDPNCPENVRMAKNICNKIFQWTQASTGMSLKIFLLIVALLFTNGYFFGTTSKEEEFVKQNMQKFPSSGSEKPKSADNSDSATSSQNAVDIKTPQKRQLSVFDVPIVQKQFAQGFGNNPPWIIFHMS